MLISVLLASIKGQRGIYDITMSLYIPLVRKFYEILHTVHNYVTAIHNMFTSQYISLLHSTLQPVGI